MPLNLPPAPVAWAMACSTFRYVICPLAILSFSLSTDMPVIWDSSWMGLNPALMNCNRSCPIR